MEHSIFSDIFYDLLQEKGLNRKQFSEQSGIPYTTVIGWTKLGRLPDYSALIKLADFFDCSLDYLTGRRDEYGRAAPSDFNSDEQALIGTYRQLSAENRELVHQLIDGLSKRT